MVGTREKSDNERADRKHQIGRKAVRKLSAAEISTVGNIIRAKIDGVVWVIPRDVRYCVLLHVDDLQIRYRHSDMGIAQKQMQKCLNKVYGWAHMN